jgi:hypothetical protein
MEFTKQVIDDIFKCYSVNALEIDGETQLVFAAEGPGSCHVYSGEGFANKKTIWEGDGGTMSVVSIPDVEGYFFVSKGFYSMVEAETSGVYLVRYKAGEFIEERVIDLPFLHRFEVLTVGDKRYFLGAALHSGKKDKEDWSNPGKLFVAEIPFDLDSEMNIELKVLKEGLYKNHGFNKGVWKGIESVFVASEEGVLAITPPQGNQEEWSLEQIFTHPVSDVAAIDIDGDGELEFALFSPFHGPQIDIFKKIDGEYKSVYQYPKAMNFYHAIFADTIQGVPSFVLGARQEDMDLYVVQYDQKAAAFKTILLDTQVGSSNAKIIHTKKGDLVMSANRQIGQAAIYKFF